MVSASESSAVCAFFVFFLLCFLCYSLFVPEKLAKKPRPESTNCSTSKIKIDCFLKVSHVLQCLDCNSKRRLNISKGPNEDAKKDFAKQEEKSKPKPRRRNENLKVDPDISFVRMKHRTAQGTGLLYIAPCCTGPHKAPRVLNLVFEGWTRSCTSPPSKSCP